jgi:hypothetical protein
MDPVVAKSLFQLSLFASNEEVDEWKMNGGDRERSGRCK